MRRIQTNFLDMMLVRTLLLAMAMVTSAATTEGDYYESWTPINITEFLDTDENIWTVITTANDSLECTVDHKEFINRTDILFSRKGLTSSGNVTTSLQGKFTGPFPYPNSMNVGLRGEDPTSVEELIYQGDGNKCGVFELRNLTRVITGPCYYLYNGPCPQYRAFDVRVRGFGGRVSANECLEWFKKEYPEETFTRYCINPVAIDTAEVNMRYT
ncbi:uncharacterized protein LOC119458932 [Dermacentor silvarum]|uniref:uncharacterized protein LOC119458932 n=1 Tax=Dermacentor silvarum TaxID=543639 RepID=UPI002101730E|nr:uncharacterized protein LOC119458932 [Dermacentor silvarum]